MVSCGTGVRRRAKHAAQSASSQANHRQCAHGTLQRKASKIVCRSRSKRSWRSNRIREVTQLPNYFTHYWTQVTFERQRNRYESASPRMSHTAGNGFRKRGMHPRDLVYIVTVLNGDLYLMGRMQVRGIYSRAEAARLLGTKDLWERGDEHLVEMRATGTAERYDLKVPTPIAHDLRFLSASGPRGLVFRDERHLDQQTLRVVRRLAPESAGALDRLLDGNGHAGSGGTVSRVDPILSSSRRCPRFVL